MAQNETLEAPALQAKKDAYALEDLIACAEGRLFGPGNCRLPLPPMLMFDAITQVSETGGAFDKGFATAEYAVYPERWFFGCHFAGDPVMPGCLGLDALWQLLGFYMGRLGAPGLGRALGVGEVKFQNMVLPTHKKVSYRIDIKRLILRRLVMGVADGTVYADDEPIYYATDLKVGLFQASAQ